MKYKERMEIAQATNQERAIRFIKKFLMRRGIDISRFTCTSLLINRKVRCILKDFKHIGSGGVGIIRSCSNCRGNEGTYDLTKSFTGSCRNSTSLGDANKLIIIPTVPRDVTPEIVNINTETSVASDMIIPSTRKIYVLD